MGHKYALLRICIFGQGTCGKMNLFTQLHKRQTYGVVKVNFCLVLLQVFLEGVKAALTADSSFQDGWYEKTPSKGLRAVARVYAGWGFSQAFYWNEVKSL
jgi:hypothetical protein